MYWRRPPQLPAATIVVVVMAEIAGIVAVHAMVKFIASLAVASKDIAAACALADGIVIVLVLVPTTVAAVIMSVSVVLAKAILEVNFRLLLP